MKLTKGDYAVVRFCCTSGLCIDCHTNYPGGFWGPGGKDRRHLVTQLDNLSKESAELVAANWSSYEAKVVRVSEVAQ